MAIMSDSDRAACWAELLEKFNSHRELLLVDKGQLRAAVNAIDQWISDNSSSFNSAIPQPQRANLTQSQKVRLLLFVINKRFETGT